MFPSWALNSTVSSYYNGCKTLFTSARLFYFKNLWIEGRLKGFQIYKIFKFQVSGSSFALAKLLDKFAESVPYSLSCQNMVVLDFCPNTFRQKHLVTVNTRLAHKFQGLSIKPRKGNYFCMQNKYKANIKILYLSNELLTVILKFIVVFISVFSKSCWKRNHTYCAVFYFSFTSSKV